MGVLAHSSGGNFSAFSWARNLTQGSTSNIPVCVVIDDGTGGAGSSCKSNLTTEFASSALD